MEFTNRHGETLVGRLELPLQAPKAGALFAHCFTCSKDIAAASRISKELAKRSIATLRFDFTGLGNSDGDFANTNFSSNVDDLFSAVEFLRAEVSAPTLLIGHSLGGAAVLAAGGEIDNIAGVVSIAAPFSPSHVQHLFSSALEQIESQGIADVALAGRKFSIKKQFVEDLNQQRPARGISQLEAPLLVLHSPSDSTVGIENARDIFDAASWPKSFVSLDGADHLLSDKKDSQYAAQIIAAWLSRLLN